MLSTEQTERFHDEGYLILDPCLEEGEVEALRERVRAIADGESEFPESFVEYEPGASGRRMEHLRKINHPSRHDPFFVGHARHPRILEAINDLLGEDVKLFGDQLFMKPPGGIEKTYHQDCPYFPIRPMQMITAWVALDEVTVENGCMYVVPGSHKLGAVDHSEPWMVGERKDMKIPDAAIDRERERPVTPAGRGLLLPPRPDPTPLRPQPHAELPPRPGHPLHDREIPLDRRGRPAELPPAQRPGVRGLRLSAAA